MLGMKRKPLERSLTLPSHFSNLNDEKTRNQVKTQPMATSTVFENGMKA